MRTTGVSVRASFALRSKSSLNIPPPELADNWNYLCGLIGSQWVANWKAKDRDLVGAGRECLLRRPSL
jgi:hypothetical protein